MIFKLKRDISYVHSVGQGPWFRWFAWRPIRIGRYIVWLQTVERRRGLLGMRERRDNADHYRFLEE
jgi:hypothetical protein